MRTDPRKTPELLDVFAAQHIAYEVRQLVETTLEFMTRYAGGVVPARFNTPTIDDALLEALLVHLRLLDEFLQSQPHPRYPERVIATDWAPVVWDREWLGKKERRRINGQVAHLDLNREDAPGWDVRDLAHRCCIELAKFVAEVEQRSPIARHASFAQVRRDVHRGLNELLP